MGWKCGQRGGGRERGSSSRKAAVSGVMGIREPQDKGVLQEEREEVAVCVQSGWEPGRHGESSRG